MNRCVAWMVAALLGLLLTLDPVGAAAEGRIIAGVNVGAALPNTSFDKYSETGVVLLPFAGYMFIEKVGLMGQLGFLGVPNRNFDADKPDPEKRVIAKATWGFMATAGPRLALPYKRAELFVTAQGGVMTSLNSKAAFSGTPPGFYVGGGVNVAVNDALQVGMWGGFSRWYAGVRLQEGSDLRYGSIGLGLTWNSAPPYTAGEE